MKKIFKVIFRTLLGIIIFITFTLLTLNGIKFLLYSDYYSIKEDVAINHGLGEGYVPQGVAYYEEGESRVYLTSGYTSNDTPSRVYVTYENYHYYVNIKVSDHNFSYGHLGGITVCGDKVYIADDKEVYICNLKDFLGKADSENKNVKVIDSVTVDVAASFIYSSLDNKYLYVGEFNNGKEYKTNHEEKVYNDKTYYAYVNVYEVSTFDDDVSPVARFSVRDKVQGFAISEDKIVLSTSFGVLSSYFYVYSIPKEFDKDNIYFLDDRYLEKTIKGPAMSEGLDYDGKQFITVFESACNKYFFGKFFGANKVVGLTI